MIAIVCIDDNNGMMFNQRRQSRDKILIEHIVNLIGSKRLWMSSYSEKLFANFHQAQMIVDEDYLEKAEIGDYCFVEDKDISKYVDKIEKVILFKWNRNYPADTFLTLDIGTWILEDTEDFVGHSHDKITKETYVR